MKTQILLFSLFLNAFLLSDLFSQEMPLVYEEEHTCEDCPRPYMPSFSELPSTSSLTDPFLWSDGRGRIEHFSDWAYRRAEIAAEVQHYETGEKPPRPENITASFEDGVLTVNVTVNEETLTLTAPITLPEGDGPFPAVIGMGGTSMPSSIFTSRNVAQLNFNYGQVMAHTQTRGNEPINDLYPELEYIGAYSAWPWGVSRLIDGLEIVAEDANIDTEHLAVSGCSFAGKMALFSGAFDERIALTFAIESGGGGYTTWRYSEILDDEYASEGGVETLAKTNYAWFIQDMNRFSSNVNKLPLDHHELMAMVAPRALFVTGNPGWTWLADESGYVGSKATEKVYEALGISDRFVYSQIGGHNHCSIPSAQIPDIEAFVDKFLLGIDTVDTDLSTSPYSTNLDSWIPWEAPELSVGTSYFGKTSLVFPANEEGELDTAITFKWNQIEEAQEYRIQISDNARFSNIVAIDSTADTLKTVVGLSKGQQYYWRVQVKTNDEGGPWSTPWNFSTSIPLPATPELISAIPVANRADYVTFSWKAVPNASRYSVQLSKQENFSSIFKSGTTTDTSQTLQGTSEGDQYYWRVQASNVAGVGPWSEISPLTVILPPTDLDVDVNASGAIILSWDDNSDVEEGYIIERMQGAGQSFAVIDTVKESDATEYTDTGIEESDTYMYRVKAYKGSGSSEYSNEVSTTITDTEEERGVPTDYSISQNYPNPFNPSTQISYSIPVASDVTISVYDISGKLIQTLVNTRKSAGFHNVNFNASALPTGIYFYEIRAGSFTQVRKMTLIK